MVCAQDFRKLDFTECTDLTDSSSVFYEEINPTILQYTFSIGVLGVKRPERIKWTCTCKFHSWKKLAIYRWWPPKSGQEDAVLDCGAVYSEA